jgi:hypothetical protein
LTSLTFAGTDTVTSVADLLRRALGLEFEPRSSDYRGGEYFVAGDWRRDPYSEVVYVQPNDDLGEPAEPEYAACPTLVYVDCTLRADQLVEVLASADLVLVQRKEWDDPRDSAATPVPSS